MAENKIPTLTSEQRAAALEKGLQARIARKEAKVKLAAGEIALSDVLESGDEAVRRMRVIDLIQAMPGYGKARAAKVMEECSIAESRRIQGARGSAEGKARRLLLGIGSPARKRCPTCRQLRLPR